jgi:hypothetical protein
MKKVLKKVTWKELKERGFHQPSPSFAVAKAVAWVERFILQVPEGSLANAAPNATLGMLRKKRSDRG